MTALFVLLIVIDSLLYAGSENSDYDLSSYQKSRSTSKRPCQSLSKYQYYCNKPLINPETQQAVACNEDDSVTMYCEVPIGVVCDGLINGTRHFYLKVPNACDYRVHIHHSTALLLSVFLGFLGVDRIYLGYYAIGLIKMFTLGGLFVIWLADVVLIALQLLVPADGTGYIINYYGPKVTALRFDPWTNYSIYTCQDCM